MAGVPRSLEIFNAREQLLSADLMRAQILASRDAQNQEAARARSIDSNAAIPAGPANLLQFVGSPISGIDEAPTLTGASGFSVTIGAGSGFLYNTGFGGLTTDDSPYLVVRWATGAVTHSTPDPSNPRIDVIVATPASANADQQSRTVLVDPTTRAVTAQSVYKTSNPSATLSIVSGTPAGTPLAPAVPTGSLPLFYVYVPAAAGSAASFAQCRASWRRASYPLAAMSGVISGLGLVWDLTADPALTDSKISVSGLHRLLIDGEVMEFVAAMDSNGAGVKPDTSNNPFSVAAPATWNKIYYVYAVGGRHSPMPSLSNGVLSPITLVESLTPPNLQTSHPTAGLTVNGVSIPQSAAVYVGIGMVVANATRRAGLIMDNEMVHFGCAVAGGNTISVIRTGAAADPFSSPPSAAQIGFSADALVSFSSHLVGSTPGYYNVHPDSTIGGISPQFSPNYGVLELLASVAAITPGGLTNGRVPWPAPGQGALWVKGGNTGDSLSISVKAYAHRVRMIGMTAQT